MAAFWEFGTAAWSEIPATLATAVGTALFLRSRRARRQLPAILAALILSFGIFIRYTNVLFLAAPAAYELGQRPPGADRALAPAVLGGLRPGRRRRAALQPRLLWRRDADQL